MIIAFKYKHKKMFFALRYVVHKNWKAHGAVAQSCFVMAGMSDLTDNVGSITCYILLRRID